MEKTARRQLLPGVKHAESPPHVVYHSRGVVVRARRRALFRDVLDLLLLAAVDLLFVRWPNTHVPALDRQTSLLLLVALNGGFLAYVWMSRAMPRWRARRVAATWCAAEQGRFFADARLR